MAPHQGRGFLCSLGSLLRKLLLHSEDTRQPGASKQHGLSWHGGALEGTLGRAQPPPCLLLLGDPARGPDPTYGEEPDSSVVCTVHIGQAPSGATNPMAKVVDRSKQLCTVP